MEQPFQQCEIAKWPSGDCRPIARLSLGLEESEATLSIRFVDDDKDDAGAGFRSAIKLPSGEQFMLVTYLHASGIEVHTDAETPPVDALLRFLAATGLPDTAVSWAPNTTYRIVAIPGLVYVYRGDRIAYAKGIAGQHTIVSPADARDIGLAFIQSDERRIVLTEARDGDATVVSTAPVPRRTRAEGGE